MKASIVAVAVLALPLAFSCAGKPAPAAAPEPEAPAALTGATEYPEAEAPAALEVAAVSLECRVLSRGQNARAEEPSVTVVRTAIAFGSAWTAIAAPGGAKPDIDFTKEAVVVAFMGRKNTGGHSVSLVGAVRLADGSVRVRLRNEAPQPGMMVTQALTSPWLALAVPAAPEAAVLVEFVE